MSSFHRADWLSLSQTIGTLVAIAGAYGVAFYQNHLDKQRRHTEAAEQARQYLVLAYDFASDGAQALSDVCTYRLDPLKTETNADRIKFRAEIAQCLEALNALQIEKLPSVTAARQVIRARAELAYAMNHIDVNAYGNGGHVPCNEAYGQPLVPMAGKLQEAASRLNEELANL